MSKDAWQSIPVRTSPAIRGLLMQLVGTGLYGCTIEDAAERILCEHLREGLLNGTSNKLRDATFWLGPR